MVSVRGDMKMSINLPKFLKKKPSSGIEKLKQKNTVRYKKLSGLDKYIIFSFSVLIIYSIFEFIFSIITDVSHDTLTVALYGAFGGELLLCAVIKKYKLKRGDADNEMVD